MNGSLVILRPGIAFAARRYPPAAQAAIIARWAALYTIGYPITLTIATLAPLLVDPGPLRWVTAVSAVHVAEHAAAVTTPHLRFWQRVWQTKRRWPTQWAIIDNTTAAVQASLGGGNNSFFTSSKTLTRPLLSHPALSIFPRLNWSDRTADWGISASGTGTTLPRIAETTDAITGAFPCVHQTRIDYPNPGSSIGVIRFWYDDERDPLAEPANAETWAQ